jgi:uncharacterized MAPEG superfamily protein
MILDTAFPALPTFACAAVALFAKTTLTSVLQVASRARARVFPIPEDARMMRGQTVDNEAPFVRRCANVWRNDTENLPFFLALALAYVLLGAPAASAQWLFGLYVGMRYLHTLVFLAGLQPWRALVYLAGMVVCWTLAIRCIALALS